MFQLLFFHLVYAKLFEVSQPNDKEQVNMLKKKFESHYRETAERHLHNCQCSSFHISREAALDCIYCLKPGKSCDDDKVSAEHLLYAPVTLLERLHQLINGMLRHAFAPN